MLFNKKKPKIEKNSELEEMAEIETTLADTIGPANNF